MPRGGFRQGAGGKPTWKHGKTKTIRVPEALADRILEIARLLDEQGFWESTNVANLPIETGSKVIDLSGVSIHAHKRGPCVYLADLLRAGYEIQPERLARGLRQKVQGDLKDKGDLDSFIKEFYDG